MTKPRVFITQPVAKSAVERLQQLATIEMNPNPWHVLSKAELCAAVVRSDILFCIVADHIDRDVLAANPELRLIASMMITPRDNIDVAEAAARRIPITVIPPMVTEATADLAFALLLAVARRIPEADGMIRAGKFPGAQSVVLEGGPVYGKTLGLVGAGKLGRAMARRARGFAMRVLYHDPRRLPEAEERELGLAWVPFERVFAEADFVSVHAALSPETRHLVGARQFALMKPSAYFLNTSRGPIVDEAALVDALKARRIAGAALDVFEHEPRIAPELLAMPNVVMAPHIGSAETELRAAMANIVVDNIQALIEGRPLPNLWTG